MAKCVDCELLQFAEAVRDMKWTVMTKLSEGIADAIQDMVYRGEKIEGLYIAYLLNSTSEDIIHEHIDKKAETP